MVRFGHPTFCVCFEVEGTSTHSSLDRRGKKDLEHIEKTGFLDGNRVSVSSDGCFFHFYMMNSQRMGWAISPARYIYTTYIFFKLYLGSFI